MRVELRQASVEVDGRPILRGVDLAVRAGTTIVVLGRSGAGLTTLLKTAAGLLAPAAGQVLHDGCDLACLDPSARRRLQTRTGFMFQDAALWANQTLAENLDLPLRAKDPTLPDDERRRRIAGALQAWGWSIPLDRRPADLSLGERRVLSFLRAVIPGPAALFLDEPLASLDGVWRERLLAHLADLRARGVTVLAAGKRSGGVEALADAVAVLDGGVIGALEVSEACGAAAPAAARDPGGKERP